MTKQLSKVEVKGLEARYYDFFMDALTLGKYNKFINDALSHIDLKNGYNIIDFGAGTGRNIMILQKRTEKENVHVEFFGADIGKIMSEKFKKKTSGYENIHFINHDIRKPFDFETGSFDAGMISFVLHGFVQKDRNKILSNFSHLIKKGGRLYIIDYNELDVNKSPWYVKFFYRKLECPLAEDFSSKNLEEILSDHGFKKYEYKIYFRNIIRLAIFERV